MHRRTLGVLVAAVVLLLSACGGGEADQSGSAAGGRNVDDLSLDELYELALEEEEGELVYYGVLAQENARQILPVFEERFPGITVEHIDATGEKLVARAVAEKRGGRVLGDVLAVPAKEILLAQQADLLLEWLPPEAEPYEDTLKGPDWVGIEEQYWVGAWNTNLVPEGEAPDSFEDFADPKWRDLGGLVGEPRDYQMILAMIQKYDGDAQRAINLFQQIAENNNPSFHDGHSELTELLVSGQAAACFTCYTHHYPPRQKDGAPVEYFLTEGVGNPVGNAVFDGAPHPLTAKLWSRWVASEEGQKAYAEGGRTPTHPDVGPVEDVRPETIYHIGTEDLQQTAPDGRDYQEVWQEIFRLR